MMKNENIYMYKYKWQIYSIWFKIGLKYVRYCDCDNVEYFS